MTMGWTGINIDASYDRMSRFYMMRKQQNNLNYVVGDSDIMATLYDLREDSSSTVSNKVVNFVKKRKPVVK